MWAKSTKSTGFGSGEWQLGQQQRWQYCQSSDSSNAWKLQCCRPWCYRCCTSLQICVRLVHGVSLAKSPHSSLASCRSRNLNTPRTTLSPLIVKQFVIEDEPEEIFYRASLHRTSCRYNSAASSVDVTAGRGLGRFSSSS